MKRRSFIQLMSIGAMGLTTKAYSVESLSTAEFARLTILHTNDWHSRIEAFPMDGSRNQGLGGVAKRAAIIEEIRKQNEHVLLLDAGDYFQGTPYFNFYSGELEVRIMNELEYDAVTIGNHEFDAGIENLAKQLRLARFRVLSANYNLNDTELAAIVKPYHIFRKGKLKIGVFGLGIEMQGLVPEKFIGNARYLDPVLEGNKTADYLKHEKSCDYIICLSHLGLKYESDKVSDHVIAAKSRNIDLIIGGHTHSFLNEPLQVENLIGKKVLINQAGWGGIMLGRVDIYFESKTKWRWAESNNMDVK